MSALPPLRIESLAHGGDGVATLPSGRKVFVPGTAPGDLVEIAPPEERGQHARSTLLRVIEPSPVRVEAACPHAARCGGCQLQHVAIEAQRAAKEEAFYAALERIGGLARSAIGDPRPIVASPASFGYRIRCRLHVRGGRVGYLRRGSHELEAISTCGLLAPELERLALAVAAAVERRPIRGLQDVDVCVGADRKGAIALHPDPRAPAGWAEKAPRTFEGIEGLQGMVVLPPPAAPAAKGRRAPPPGMGGPAPRIYGDPVVARPAPLAEGVALLGRPDVFAQANAAGNEALVRAAIDGLALRGDEQVLELFCGAGNFTFGLAARSAHVTAVELEGASLDLARRAAARVEGVRFVAADAARVVEDFAREGRRFDACLLDPPRSGAKGVAEALGRLGPRRIAYVSCDPATLARDLAALRSAGYEARIAVPVDMFPQTFHVEGVVILERPTWKHAS